MFFRLLCFLYKYDGLCEISEKFLWQTIWDLPKNFQLQEIYWYEEECGFLKTSNFNRNLHLYAIFKAYFLCFSDFCVFCISTMGSARSQKNFFDKQSEICQKISSSKKYTGLKRRVEFPKTHNFKTNLHIFGYIIYTF